MSNHMKKQAAVLENSPEAQLRQKLLNRVAAFYHKTFQEQAQPQAALKALGLTDVSLFADFKVGFANGTLLSIIPEGSELQEALKGLGLLTQEGKEAFEGCVTFPWFNENSDCVGLWALRVSDGVGCYLPGPRVGVWNWQAMKRSRHVFLAASILDALFLYQAGYREVVPLWGEKGLADDHKRAFQRYGLKEVFLTFEAGEKIYRALEEEEITARVVLLPSPVPDFFRRAGAAKEFETLLTGANPKTPLESERLRKAKETGWERTDTGFMVQYGERGYEIKSIQKEGVKLKVTLKAFIPGREEWFLDSVDLYSHRSRVFFAKACKEYFREKAEVIEADLGKLLELAERFQAQPQEAAKQVKLTHAEEKEALGLLKDPTVGRGGQISWNDRVGTVTPNHVGTSCGTFLPGEVGQSGGGHRVSP